MLSLLIGCKLFKTFINKIDEHSGWNLLQWASNERSISTIMTLVSHGADRDNLDEGGYSVVHKACADSIIMLRAVLGLEEGMYT